MAFSDSSNSKRMRKMRKNVLFFILVGLMNLPANGYGQVSIIPELGVSYAPFTLYGANITNTSNRLDYLFGINGRFNVNERLLMNTRLSYVDRENFKWTELCICPGYLYSAYEQQDLNLDFNILFSYKQLLNAGLGASIVKKINTSFISKNIDSEDIRDLSNFYYGMNGVLEVEYRKFHLKIMYVRRFKPDDLVFYLTEGQNRFDLSIGYSLLKNK